MSDVRTVKLKFSDLVFLEDNPRTITRDNLERLAERIRKDPTFFENRPCLVNYTGGQYVCYGGFQRSHAAAKILKWKEVPCSVENDIPTELMRERAILDNTHDGDWNADVLANWEFDIPELRDMGVPEFVFGEGSNALNSEKLEAQEDDYEIPEEIKTDIVPGDLFEIGPHRLLCGDSTNADDVAKLMDGGKADMVFTDPPYGLDYSGGRTQVVKNKPYGKIENDDLKGEELGRLIRLIFFQGAKELYFCASPIILEPFLNEISINGKEVDAIIVWDKKQPGLGYMKYRRQCEFIIYIREIDFNKDDESDFDLWSISRDNGQNYVHSTQKPVELAARAIKNSSQQNNLILDPFLGSGTTMVAAHQLNRRCYGMEIDAKYCQVIIDRMLKLDPTLEIKRNGQPYQKAG